MISAYSALMKDYPPIMKSPCEKAEANVDPSTLLNVNWQTELETRKAAAGGFLNITFEAIDRHLASGTDSQKTALRFISKKWPRDPRAVQDITYAQLYESTCRFANALNSSGLKKGDVLFALSPRIPELYTTILGTLRAGLVFSPLFSAFGPEPIAARVSKGQGKVLFSLASYYRKKIEPIRSSMESLKYVVLIDDDGSLRDLPNVIDFAKLLQEASPQPICERTQPEDMALLHFTSGTTGKPKGAAHVHAAVVYHHLSGRYALDLKKNDVFWCTADPGWVTGISYGVISPLTNGVTMLIDEADFQAPRWYQILQDFKVTNWYTAPTAMRMLMKAGEEIPRKFSREALRIASSVGEPLNPEVIHWAEEHLKISLHDNWWQSETGGIMVSNFLAINIKPGSMGLPMPGVDVRLARRSESGSVEFIDKPGVEGEIVIRKGWPSMFRTYLGDPDRYLKCFSGDWYFSGDLATRDADGYFWFIGRTDDVIKSAGHLIGPFEVESTLMEHPAVLESAVIGKPDKLAGEIVKAFVVLKAGHIASEDLELDILSHARKKLGVAVAPREFAFVDNLPKTRSGKIMRRLLKARELGLPEGDTSTLESGS